MKLSGLKQLSLLLIKLLCQNMIQPAGGPGILIGSVGLMRDLIIGAQILQ